MARRRYQRGSLDLMGKRERYWLARWREDVYEDGETKRKQKSARFPLKDYPTRRAAERGLDDLLRRAGVNEHGYRARPIATFEKFVEKWKETVLSQQKPSSRSATKSRLKKALVPFFGKFKVADINTEMVQDFISKQTCSPKTVRNLIADMRSIWNSAKAWGYVSHEPFEHLSMPEYARPDQPCFSVADVQKIIEASPEPYKTLWWLVSETGIRRGEVCALQVGDIDFDNQVVIVRRNISCGKVVTPKSRRPRVFNLSTLLTDRLRVFSGGGAEAWLFTSKEGKRLHPDNLVARHLAPIVEKLNLAGAAHAFRHGNATMMDFLNAPLAVRQGRLGHVDSKTTMEYTHRTSSDDKEIAEQLGALITTIQ